jgi:hypothetical protein
MSKEEMNEMRNLQTMVENARLAERKRCHELTLRLFGNTEEKVLLFLADGIMSGWPVPPVR